MLYYNRAMKRFRPLTVSQKLSQIFVGCMLTVAGSLLAGEHIDNILMQLVTLGCSLVGLVIVAHAILSPRLVITDED